MQPCIVRVAANVFEKKGAVVKKKQSVTVPFVLWQCVCAAIFVSRVKKKKKRQWLCAVVCEAASVVQLIVNCQGVCI